MLSQPQPPGGVPLPLLLLLLLLLHHATGIGRKGVYLYNLPEVMSAFK